MKNKCFWSNDPTLEFAMMPNLYGTELSGHNLNATLINTGPFPTDSAHGQSLFFPYTASSNIIYLQSANIGKTISAFTIALWIKWESASLIAQPLDRPTGFQVWNPNSTPANQSIRFQMAQFQQPLAGVLRIIGSTASNNGVGSFNLQNTSSVWHHVAITYDMVGGTALSYVDGINTLTQSITGLGTVDCTQGNLIIGAGQGAGVGAGIGIGASMADVLFFSRVLSASEINYIYSCGYPVSSVLRFSSGV